MAAHGGKELRRYRYAARARIVPLIVVCARLPATVRQVPCTAGGGTSRELRRARRARMRRRAGPLPVGRAQVTLETALNQSAQPPRGMRTPRPHTAAAALTPDSWTLRLLLVARGQRKNEQHTKAKSDRPENSSMTSAARTPDPRPRSGLLGRCAGILASASWLTQGPTNIIWPVTLNLQTVSCSSAVATAILPHRHGFEVRQQPRPWQPLSRCRGGPGSEGSNEQSAARLGHDGSAHSHQIFASVVLEISVYGR